MFGASRGRTLTEFNADDAARERRVSITFTSRLNDEDGLPLIMLMKIEIRVKK